ncbi:MAG: general secretion pathway protein GspD [Sphingobacteriaceae bacterium]|nr:general secretion pathway protein GspD [Sphingobacteriaceae bacterium]
MKIKIIISVFLFGFCLIAKSQDRFAILEQKLIELSKSSPGLNEKVDLSINGSSIQEYIRAIAASNNLNVNIDPTIDIKVSNNFSKVTAQEVFIFLCRSYNLDITFVGPIMSFIKYVPPTVPLKAVVSKKINVSYEPTAGLLSFDFQNDTLSQAAKEITKQTGKNIIFSPDLSGKLVNGFVQNSPLNSALEKLAFANDMKVSMTPDNFYILEKKLIEGNKNNSNNNSVNNFSLGNSSNKNSNLMVKNGLITVDAQNILMSDLVASVSKELGKEYFLFNELKGNSSLKINESSYDDFLRLLFNGTDFTFKKDGEIYLLGDRNLEGLRQSKLITLKNRTIDKVLEFIPGDLKKGVDIKTFPDLNGLIVSGSQPRINELEAFIRQIDIVVPLVHIEVIIADVRKSNTISTGISAGIGAKPAANTQGGLLPQVDLSLNATAINNLISGINGLGIINLGSVTPNFYLTLKALEEQGALKIRSTPQIATLNGHEAKLKVGSTVYYLEVQNNLINTNNNSNTNITQSQQYKSLDADLSITINPQVSGDEQITMTVGVTQSSFTERISETAPPGKLNRDFQSLIRVKNGEMIMLGGLEENSTSNSGKGLPLISRIPVLKWIFGNRTKSKTENKLTIFIKPTIIYN